jgi:hypothetical protein
LLAALLALASQLILGIAAPDAGIRATPDQQLSALLADPGVICHDSSGGGQKQPHHHAVDCLLCPYCGAITAAAVLRGDDPALPIPRAGLIALAVSRPNSIKLPPSALLTARPRGPPVLG